VDRFIDSVESSIQTENWYAALGIALAIPDICGWLENPSKKSQERYQDWFDKYLSKNYKHPADHHFAFLASGDCYALRCSFLHQGIDDISNQRAKEVLARFVFTSTGPHCNRIDDVLVLNVGKFCAEMCDAAREWHVAVKGTAEIQQRIQELMTIRSGPFMVVPGIQIGK